MEGKTCQPWPNLMEYRSLKVWLEIQCSTLQATLISAQHKYKKIKLKIPQQYLQEKLGINKNSF